MKGKCALCDLAKDESRGWKTISGDLHCPDCFRKTFILRTLTVPIASVVAGYDPQDWSQERCKSGWTAFRAAVREGCRSSVRLANRLLFELAGMDTQPLTTGKKGPKLPKLPEDSASILRRLYGIGRAEFADLDSQAVGVIRNKVFSAYKSQRFAIRITGSESLRTYRHFPVPVPQSSQRSLEVREKQPFLSFRLGGERFTVRLRNGHSPLGDYRRAASALECASRGESLLAEYSFRERPISQGRRTRVNGSGDKPVPGGAWQPTEIVCSICVWMPRKKNDRTESTLVVKTGKDALLTALLEDRDHLWSLHEDHARQRIAAYTERLQRFADDTKFERRRPRKNKIDIAERRTKIVADHRRWMDDFCHKATAMVIGLAVRNRCGTIVYDDTNREWLDSFPWFKLHSMLQSKCEENSITLDRRTVSDKSE